MSINSMADTAVSKNLIQPAIEKNYEIIDPVNGDEVDLTPPNTITVTSALSVLFAYIPTEIIALYVTVLAALGPIDGGFKTQWITFGVFLVCTPLVVWATYAAKINGLFGTIPFKFSEWPKWEMSAATIAFIAWGFALPQTPFNAFGDWYSSALASVSILVTSTILGLAAPFFEKKTP